MTRPKLSFNEQIEKLKSKGVKFNVIDEHQAKEMLMTTSYYYKIVSYKRNFIKGRHGKYINLEFAYLYDLSTIDMRLRYELMKMCLDYEHALKLKVLSHITNNSNEDGYSIVQDFMSQKNRTIEDLVPSGPTHSSYTNSLYKTNKDEPSVWVVIETMGFGDFSRFIEFYNSRIGYQTDEFSQAAKITRYVKNIRNACAHNHPFLMNIVSQKKGRYTSEVHKYISSMTDIPTDIRNKNIRNGKIHDILALFIAYNTYVDSSAMKKHRYDDLMTVMERCKRNKEFYKNHSQLTGTYSFFSKVLANIQRNL